MGFHQNPVKFPIEISVKIVGGNYRGAFENVTPAYIQDNFATDTSQMQ